MDHANEFKESADFGVLYILGASIFALFLVLTIHFFILFHMVLFSTEEAVEAVDKITTTSTTSNSSRRKLNLLEIMSHLYWFYTIREAGRGFMYKNSNPI